MLLFNIVGGKEPPQVTFCFLWMVRKGNATVEFLMSLDKFKANSLEFKVAENPHRQLFVFYGWCERGESNPHGSPHRILSPARLPIPPLSHHLKGGQRKYKIK